MVKNGFPIIYRYIFRWQGVCAVATEVVLSVTANSHLMKSAAMLYGRYSHSDIRTDEEFMNSVYRYRELKDHQSAVLAAGRQWYAHRPRGRSSESNHMPTATSQQVSVGLIVARLCGVHAVPGGAGRGVRWLSKNLQGLALTCLMPALWQL